MLTTKRYQRLVFEFEFELALELEKKSTVNRVDKLVPNLYPLPSLCLSCKKKDDPNEEILCGLNRMDQVGEAEFKCFAYEKK